MKKILMWLEDRPEEMADILVKTEEKFDEVCVRSKPSSIKNLLEEYGSDPNIHICGIIIDIMLTKVNDLEDVGLKHIKTPGGFEAGFAFMQYVLLTNNKWRQIPMCILTQIQDNRVEEMLGQNDFSSKSNEQRVDIITIEKYVGKWEEKLLGWMDYIRTQAKG